MGTMERRPQRGNRKEVSCLVSLQGCSLSGLVPSSSQVLVGQYTVSRAGEGPLALIFVRVSP